MIPRLHEVLRLDRPLIGIDLETTGVKPETSGIVELALEIMVPGREPKEYRTLVNPLMVIPPEATAIHHITNEMVADAPTFAQLADNLLKGLSGCDYAGYNVKFDLRQLSAEFRRAGKSWTSKGARVIDGFRLWQIAEGRTLAHAVDHWLKGSAQVDDQAIIDELGPDGAHTALWDIKMSTRIIAAQLRGCQSLPRDLQQLHDLCWPNEDEWYDDDGKLRWNKDGQLYMSFGKHKDEPLQRVPKSYLAYMIKCDFSEPVKHAWREAVEGRFISK